ncbi:ABC transporter permease [Oleiagrimonas sp. C23AA]|uniref:ABC transporter permease n=1 Tax=Oleiagrimonas sp. C23AA TaxID=2719047 RepID=UPI00142135B8|nr:ABC transporter permease [Oleiagrimonas sp. C23AA]NII12040.1 FtsX-like permease family protein [Oleiagrimonas sp. C23AA]
MTVHPIIAALRRHKAGVILIGLQIALTLAIVCNAVFIIGQRISRVDRPTGINESNLFLVTQQYVGAPSSDTKAGADKLDTMELEDAAALRQLPSVAKVSVISSMPLLNSAWNGGMSTKPQAKSGFKMTTYYFGDQNMLSTLGAQLVAGRDFNAGDVQHAGFRTDAKRPVVIVTQSLAHKLFPNGSALGKTVYMDGSGSPSTIIGIVKRLQTPSTSDWASSFAYDSTLIPTRKDAFFSRYLVRAKPGQMKAAMAAAHDALFKVNPMRVIDDDMGIRSFASIRAEAYKQDVSMAILMGAVCIILLALTAAGIVGLTSFWVGQRTKQIGVRRALGARGIDILRYFQLENLFIAGMGVVVGLLLAIGVNQWLVQHFEMDRMPLGYLFVGVLVVLVLGQLAVFVPARRASRVPPVTATRSV